MMQFALALLAVRPPGHSAAGFFRGKERACRWQCGRNRIVSIYQHNEPLLDWATIELRLPFSWARKLMPLDRQYHELDRQIQNVAALLQVGQG
jgi:hypothetical protein